MSYPSPIHSPRSETETFFPSLGDIDSSEKLAERHHNAQINRQRLIDARRSKLAHHSSRVSSVLAHYRHSQHEQHNSLYQSLTDAQERAELKRTVHLQNQVVRNAHKVAKAKHLAQAKRSYSDKGEEASKRDRLEQSLLNAEKNRQAYLLSRKTRSHQVAKAQKAAAERSKMERVQHDARLSNLMQSMDAAQQKRAKVISGVVEQSKEVVARAKKVAEKEKKRRQERELLLRRVIEERLQRGEERRTRLRKQEEAARSVRKRKVSAEKDDSTLALLEQDLLENAVRHIQNWWRHIKIKSVALSFIKLDLFDEGVPSLSFEDLVARLQKPQVIRITGRLLARMEKSLACPQADKLDYQALLGPPKSADTKKMLNLMARNFLSTMMMLYHPNVILGKQGDREEHMLSVFQVWLVHFKATPSSLAAMEAERHDVLLFHQAYHNYLDAFQDWKRRDTDALLDDMIRHYRHLDELWTQVRDGPEAELWRSKIREQRRDLRVQIVKLGGDRAQEQLERYESQHQTVESEPLSPVHAEAHVASQSEGWTTAASETEKEHSDVEDSVASGKIALPKDSVSMAEQSRLNAALDTVSQLSGGMSNVELLHELIMEPSFRIGQEEEEDAEVGEEQQLIKRVKHAATAAFFDKVRQDIQTAAGRAYWVPSLLVDIRARILSLIPPNTVVHQQADQLLDEQLISQQVKHDAFDLRGSLQRLVDIMAKVCAPVRDAAIASLAAETSSTLDAASILQRVLALLDVMKMDLLNHQLAQLRPHLIKYGPGYEREWFQSLITSQKVKLDITDQWLLVHVNEAREEARRRDPENVNHQASRVRYDAVYNDALLALIFTEPAEGQELAMPIPETFSLDRHRVIEMRRQAKRVAITATLVTLARNFAFRKLNDPVLVAQHAKQLAVTLLKALALYPHVVTNEQDMVERLYVAVQHACEDAQVIETPSEVDQRCSIIRSVTAKALKGQEPVYNVILRRVQSAVRQKVLATSNGQLLRSILERNGLDMVVMQVEKLAAKVALLADWNRTVYATWYDQLLSVHTKE